MTADPERVLGPAGVSGRELEECNPVANPTPSPEPTSVPSSSSWLDRMATMAGVAHQRRVWTSRAASWDHGGATGLGKVVAAVLAEAAAGTGTRVVDIGCGTGSLSLPLAEAGAEVLAVDISPAMIERVEAAAREKGLANLAGVARPVEELDLPEASVDLVVSNYALHHLRDPDKARLVATALRWLRPGGRLVIGDMMLGRGGSARDREIIASKVKTFAARGPAGWWRIAKNAVRYLLRVQERPLSLDAWQDVLGKAGFAEIRAIPVVAEAAVVAGTKPGA